MHASLQGNSAGSPASGSSGSPSDWHDLIDQSDPEEVRALANFHKELQQIRALKSVGQLILNSPAPVVAEEPPKPRTLALGTCPSSGKWAMVPKAEIKQEPAVDTAATADSAVQAEDKGKHDDIDSDSDALDAVSKASLKAMEQNLHAKRSKQLHKGLHKRLQSRKKNMRHQLQSKQGHHVQHQLLQLRSSR